jgi:hypothetical protein
MTPQTGDLWLASTLVTDQTNKLGLSRLWLLGPDLSLKRELATGRYGMVSGLGRDPRTGVLYALDPTARQVTRVGADGAILPGEDLGGGRGLGSIVFLPDGGFVCGEHLCGDAPPFHGDGRLLRYDAAGRLKRLYRPTINGGVSGFLGLTHMTLLNDGETLLYVSETGNTVYRFNLASGAQEEAFYVRTDPPGFVFGLAAMTDGSVILACGTHLRRLSPKGEEIKRYAMPEGRGWAFVSPAADGNSFWCGDFFGGAIAKIALADGAIVKNAKFDAPFGLTSIIEVPA